MTKRIRYTNDGERYFLDGSEVTRAEFDAACPDKGIRNGANVPPPSCWPMKSIAAGIHPSAASKEIARARAAGIDIDFSPRGEAIFRDRHHRAAYLRTRGLHDRDAGYGDPTV